MAAAVADVVVVGDGDVVGGKNLEKLDWMRMVEEEAEEDGMEEEERRQEEAQWRMRSDLPRDRYVTHQCQMDGRREEVEEEEEEERLEAPKATGEVKRD